MFTNRRCSSALWEECPRAKGHEELLQAARLLRDRGSTARFLVVGDASHGEEEYARTIRTLAQTLGVQDRVTFAGYRADIPALMASFDILAFPSHAESFGVVLIEAMAMGLPVVSTNTDGVVDIVVDGLSGIMVPRRGCARTCRRPRTAGRGSRSA